MAPWEEGEQEKGEFYYNSSSASTLEGSICDDKAKQGSLPSLSGIKAESSHQDVVGSGQKSMQFEVDYIEQKCEFSYR